MLAIDTVTLAIRDHRGRHREAALVAPTHPLRALWLAAWAELAEQWLTATKNGSQGVPRSPPGKRLLRLLVAGELPPGAADHERPAADGR